MRWRRSPVAVTCSAVAVSRASGRGATRHRRGEPDADEHHAGQQPAQPAERRVGVGQRPRDLQRLALRAAAREDAQMDVVDGLVAQERGAPAGGDVAHLGRHRQDDRRVGQDRLAGDKRRLRDPGRGAERDVGHLDAGVALDLDLGLVLAAPGRGAGVRDGNARRAAARVSVLGSDDRELRRRPAQRVVDAGAQVVADDDVGDGHRQRDRQGDRDGAEQDDAAPERHGRGARRT
jgi:hypothetical protein